MNKGIALPIFPFVLVALAIFKLAVASVFMVLALIYGTTSCSGGSSNPWGLSPDPVITTITYDEVRAQIGYDDEYSFDKDGNKHFEGDPLYNKYYFSLDDATVQALHSPYTADLGEWVVLNFGSAKTPQAYKIPSSMVTVDKFSDGSLKFMVKFENVNTAIPCTQAVSEAKWVLDMYGTIYVLIPVKDL